MSSMMEGMLRTIESVIDVQRAITKAASKAGATKDDAADIGAFNAKVFAETLVNRQYQGKNGSQFSQGLKRVSSNKKNVTIDLPVARKFLK